MEPPPPREPEDYGARAADLAARIIAEAGQLAEAPGADRYQIRRLKTLRRCAAALAGTALASETDCRTFRG